MASAQRATAPRARGTPADPWIVEHAHSYPIETFADFGLIGIGLNLALLVAWGLAVLRARFAGVRKPASQEVPAETSPGVLAQERAGLLTLLCVVVAFGVHSTIDWTWFVPGTALPALLCAGWLAGRGPLTRRSGGLRPRPALLERPALAASIMSIAAVVRARCLGDLATASLVRREFGRDHRAEQRRRQGRVQ